MCAFSSGLEVMNALGHNHVLWHNVRLDMQDDSLDQSMFMYHTHDSHHICLVNVCMKLWNTLIEGQKQNGPLPANIRTFPELQLVDSGEKFGLVKMSAEVATHYSLVTIKQEPGDDTLDLSSQDLLDTDCILQEISVDPALLKALFPELTAPFNASIPEPAALLNTSISEPTPLNASIPGHAALNTSIPGHATLNASIPEPQAVDPRRASVSESSPGPSVDAKGKGVCIVHPPSSL